MFSIPGSGPWAIELVDAKTGASGTPPTFYSGYSLAPESPGKTTEAARVPTWSSRSAAELVADSLAPLDFRNWKVVLFLNRPVEVTEVTTESETLRMMSNACVRAAETAQSVSDRMFRQKNHDGQFFEADAADLRRAASVLAVLSGASANDGEANFADRVLTMGIEELRYRILAQGAHIKAYASTLDDFGLAFGQDGRREPQDLRSAWLAAQEGVRMPLHLRLERLISLCLAMAPSYPTLKPSGRKAVRDNVLRWFEAIRTELRRDEWPAEVQRWAADSSIDAPF